MFAKLSYTPSTVTQLRLFTYMYTYRLTVTTTSARARGVNRAQEQTVALILLSLSINIHQTLVNTVCAHICPLTVSRRNIFSVKQRETLYATRIEAIIGQNVPFNTGDQSFHLCAVNPPQYAGETERCS